MNNKKYHFDMKNQNYQACNNHIYAENLEDDREMMLDMILRLFFSHKPEHVIDVLIPVLYSYCISVCMAKDLRSSIEFFDDFRKTMNGEMKGFITFLQLKQDANEVKRHGKES